MNPDILFGLGSAPPVVQPALRALWSLDHALGQVLATGREPMISRIRLAWWREALEKLDRESAPKEPVLEALSLHVLERGIAGSELAEMESAWLAILHDQPIEAVDLEAYANKRGGLLFGFTARLLGAGDESVERAGEAWALVDLARHSTDQHDVEAALTAARSRFLSRRWPKALRPLGMIAALTKRDLEKGSANWEEPGVPPRTARMLRHRLTGW